MKSVTLTVGGRSFQVRSDAGEEHLEALAAEVDRRFRSIERRGPRGDGEMRAMTMVAIVLLDELERAEARRDAVIGRARAFAEKLIRRIDELLDPNRA